MKILVVLSARLVNQELRYRFGDIPSCLIPYKGKPIIDTIYNDNKDQFDKIIIICGENTEQLTRHVENNNLSEIELIEASDYSTLEKSLLSLEQRYDTEDISNVSIIYGDTYVNPEEIQECFGNNTILTSKVLDSSRWTIILNGQIFDKQIIESEEELDAIIGFFNIIDPHSFFEILKENTFYNTLLAYCDKNGCSFMDSKSWVDVGHEDNYIKSKKNKTRYFNSLEIDYETGILRKTSMEKEKFINEIQWYLKIPNKISYLTPRVFDYSLNFDHPFIEMEYYSYETIHEIYIYGNLTVTEWKNIYINLINKVKIMKKYRYDAAKEEISACLRKMYITKTEERLDKLRDDSRFNTFFQDDSININNVKYDSLNNVIDKLNRLYLQLNIEEIEYFSLIHGDYFFANILYDSNNNIVRLIDPRGDFGGFGIYGDSRYDLAKLMHSIDGKYDLIVEDLFKLEFNESSISYEYILNNNQVNAEKAFMETVSKHQNTTSLKFIESILFLSMVPLHADNFERQLLMMARGIELLDEVERSI